MSAPCPTIGEDVLQQLIVWIRGYLTFKRIEPDSEKRTRTLAVFTGFELALTELWSLRQRELIEWHDVAQQLPEADASVLIVGTEFSQPVWIGWFDGTDWYESGGCVITGTVVRWAPLPTGGLTEPRALS